MLQIPQSTARRVMLKLFDAGTTTAATGKTLAVVLSKAGGAFGNPSAGATNATELSNGWYYVDLSTTDTGTLGDLIVRGTASGCDDSERLLGVVKATNGGLTALPDAAADAAGGLPVSDAGGLDLDTQLGTLTNGTYGLSSIKNDTAAIALDTGTDGVLVAASAVSDIQSGLATSVALATVAGYIDTEVAAIKAKTDTLPASPAATGDIPSASTVAAAVLSAASAAPIAADVKKINAVTLQGSGTALDPMEPA